MISITKTSKNVEPLNVSRFSPSTIFLSDENKKSKREKFRIKK
jgi:hypothetical protein